MEDHDVEGVYQYIIEPALHAYASLAFEDVCREFVRRCQKQQKLPFRYAKMGRWFGKTTLRDDQATNGLRVGETEIDLLAISRNAQDFLVGECKFKNSPFSYSDYLNTLAKMTPLKDKARFFYALFSESGFDQKIEAEANTNQHLFLYDLDAIVNAK